MYNGTGIADLTIGTTTNLTNPYKFSVYWSAGQSNYMTSSNTFYITKYDTKLYDTGSNFSTSTYLFTAPITGFYHFTTQVQINSGTNALAGYLSFSHNGSYNVGSIPETAVPSTASTGSISPTLSWDVNLTAGDTVGTYTACSTGSIGVGGGAGVTYFSGYLVSNA